ncbi:MAG: general stress protein, partial [Isosphaeraceae bacterium]|nr:general stress protein [Isosphaeraceae bacterium]
MAQKQRSTIVGVFTDRTQADRAISELRQAGFRDDQIGVAGRHTDETGAVTTEAGTQWETGAVTGAVAGGGRGGLV